MLCPSVLWQVEPVSDEIGYLVEEISKRSIEVTSKQSIEATPPDSYSKLQEERNDLKMDW